MSQSKFDEKKLLVVAAAVAFAGLFAVLVKKLLDLPDKDDPTLYGKKMHCYLRLPKEKIQRYIDSKAVKMQFEFRENNKRVKLYLVGCDAADKECFREKIKTPYGRGKDVPLENIKFGPFEQEHHDKWLHETLTKTPLKDWEFKPVPCDLPGGKGYVSYDMSDEAQMMVYRINPCPPGCRPPVL